jgi:hypothetical protein
MSLIETATLLRIADRAAYQYKQLKETCDAIKVVGSGLYFDTVSATNDADVEIPCGTQYHYVDLDFDIVRCVKNGTGMSSIIGAMEAHFNRLGIDRTPLMVGGWDGYLAEKDVRVSYYFAEFFKGVRGFYMVANNVFSETEDQFARIQRTTGPAIIFTDGLNYGNGRDTNPADGECFAATQLKVVVTTMGETDLEIRLTVKDINNNLKTVDVLIPASSLSGTVIPVGTTSDRFLDVTEAIIKPLGAEGTMGDDVKVMNLKERQISL